MKTSTAVFLIVIITWCTIDVDAFFSFNFSGGIYPGFTFVRAYRLEQKYKPSYIKYADVPKQSPREHVNNYDWSQYYSKSIINGTGSDDNEMPQIRNYGSHHRNHRH